MAADYRTAGIESERPVGPLRPSKRRRCRHGGRQLPAWSGRLNDGFAAWLDGRFWPTADRQHPTPIDRFTQIATGRARKLTSTAEWLPTVDRSRITSALGKSRRGLVLTNNFEDEFVVTSASAGALAGSRRRASRRNHRRLAQIGRRALHRGGHRRPRCPGDGRLGLI